MPGARVGDLCAGEAACAGKFAHAGDLRAGEELACLVVNGATKKEQRKNGVKVGRPCTAFSEFVLDSMEYFRWDVPDNFFTSRCL